MNHLCFLKPQNTFLAVHHLAHSPGTHWRPHHSILAILSDTCVVPSLSSISSTQHRQYRTKRRTKLMDAKNRWMKTLKDPKTAVMKVKTFALKENILTWPNLLCVTRILLTPYVGYLVVHGDFRSACWVFAIAGFTDLLDGFIARRYPSQRSNAGSFLDPLADKFLVTTLVLTLTAVHLIPVPLTALIVFRDVCLITAACIIRFRSLPPPRTLSGYFDPAYATANLSPTTISKYNTGVQLALVLATLASPVFGYVDHQMLHYLWYITAATTLTSGFSYMFQKNTYKYFLPKDRRTPL